MKFYGFYIIIGVIFLENFIKGIPITKVNESDTEVEKYVNNLTISDVRTILEILLLTLKQQPDGNGLKVLNILFKRMLANAPVSKEKSEEIFHDLEKGNLIGLINTKKLFDAKNPVSNNTPICDNDSKSKNEINSGHNNTMELLIKQMNKNTTEAHTDNQDELKNNAKTTNINKYTKEIQTSVPTTEENDQYLTLLPTTVTSSSGLFEQTSFQPEDFITSSITPETTTINMEETTKTEEQTNAVTPVTTENLNTKFHLPITQATNTKVSNDIFNSYKITDTRGLNNVEDYNNFKKSSHFKNLFPAVDENILKILNKYNIKLIRTYSETIEPVFVKDQLKTKTQSRKKRDVNENLFKPVNEIESNDKKISSKYINIKADDNKKDLEMDFKFPQLSNMTKSFLMKLLSLNDVLQ